MTYFSHIRTGLIASALLLTTALASPTSAETLPEISPKQIASDVKVQFNPQTGAREYIAPSFDPFEEDPSMAGTASLRSVANAITIDGQSVRGGALLDMTFYYNSQSSDPYDTRGYEEAVYLSGEYAPVTRRDNRILECNEQVQDVVYYHEDYYRPSLHVNLFRPYRHYRGHFGYGRGFGYDYGRGYRGYGGYRGYRGGRGYRRGYDGDRRRSRGRRNATDRIVDRAVDEARREARRDNRDERRGNRSERNRDEVRTESRRRDTGRIIDRPYRMGTNTGAAGRGNSWRRLRDNARSERNRRARTEERSERAPNNRNSVTRNSGTRNNSLAGTAARRAATRAAAPRPAPRTSAPRPTPRAEAPAPRPQRVAPAPRRERAQNPRRARVDRAIRRANEFKTRNTPRRNTGRKGNPKLRMMNFLPMASSWSRNVVRNVDVQCAREEMLTVHIPQERLDAARFDGLTVLVLDRRGNEVPVFVPPNYIEGFRQAVSGRVTPNDSYQAPITPAPIYQEPRSYGVEQAPCPAGTTKQSDGTCLQGGTLPYSGYPVR